MFLLYLYLYMCTGSFSTKKNSLWVQAHLAIKLFLILILILILLICHLIRYVNLTSGKDEVDIGY